MLDKPIVTESSNSNAPIVLTVPRSGVTPPALRSHSPQPRVGQAARGREGRGKWLVRLEAVDELPGGRRRSVACSKSKPTQGPPKTTHSWTFPWHREHTPRLTTRAHRFVARTGRNDHQGWLARGRCRDARSRRGSRFLVSLPAACRSVRHRVVGSRGWKEGAL
jgi:hypothetical protein